MKKIVKWALILLGAIVVLAVVGYAFMFLKVKGELAKFIPLETGWITNDVFAAKDGFSNVYFIQDGRDFIAIDCGNSAEVLAEQMKTLRIDPAKVTTVLLTHTDGDHIGALGLFPDAKLYISREEEQMINGRKARTLWFKNRLSCTDYTLVDDRQVLQIGNLKVEGILAPGHTTGIMAWLVDDRYLFSGDIASLVNGKIAPVPAIFNMDKQQALGSTDIIRDIPTARYIFTGHWGWAEYPTAITVR